MEVTEVVVAVIVVLLIVEAVTRVATTALTDADPTVTVTLDVVLIGTTQIAATSAVIIVATCPMRLVAVPMRNVCRHQIVVVPSATIVQRAAAAAAMIAASSLTDDDRRRPCRIVCPTTKRSRHVAVSPRNMLAGIRAATFWQRKFAWPR